MPEILQVIQMLVAPVVMISANGLICLALYNRLAAIVSRLRIFHKERFDASRHLSEMPLAEQTSQAARQLRNRCVALDNQARRILRRAKLIRAALVLLLSAVICMLACSLALGLSLQLVSLAGWALMIFILGVVVMMLAMLLAMAELFSALEPVTTEGSSLDAPQAIQEF